MVKLSIFFLNCQNVGQVMFPQRNLWSNISKVTSLWVRKNQNLAHSVSQGVTRSAMWTVKKRRIVNGVAREAGRQHQGFQTIRVEETFCKVRPAWWERLPRKGAKKVTKSFFVAQKMKRRIALMWRRMSLMRC